MANRPIYVALAVTCEGTRDILGLWAGEHGDGEGAKYWMRAGVGMLAVLGAAGGWLLARLTRLASALDRRVLVLTVGGLVSLPLAVAIGQLRHGGSVGIGLVMIAGWAGAVIHVCARQRWVLRRYARALR